MPWSTTPAELLTEIIVHLKDNLAALNSYSQTCKTLLPICRQHLFRVIHLNSKSEKFSFFRSLLDSNPEIAGYVRELWFHFHAPDLGEDIPHALNQLQQISIFSLIGPQAEWEDIEESLKQSLLRIIHSPSLNRLVLGSLFDFPIFTFIHCANLTSMLLLLPINDRVEDQDIAPGHKGPQLLDFDYLGHTGDTVLQLVNSRLPKNGDIPIIDFTSLRKLGCTITDGVDQAAARDILRCAEKLKTLRATIQDTSPGLRGLSQWLNPLARDTLKELSLSFILKRESKDPFVGHCDELKSLAGIVALETITVDCVIIDSGPSRELGSSMMEWSRLCDVLRNGFPELKRFSMDIKVVVMVASMPKGIITLKNKLESLPELQLWWLSNESDIDFHFSVVVKRVDSAGIGEEEEFLSSSKWIFSEFQYY